MVGGWLGGLGPALLATAVGAGFLLPAAGVEQILSARGRAARSRDEVDVVDVIYLQRALGVSD